MSNESRAPGSAMIQWFEDLVARQKAGSLARDSYDATRSSAWDQDLDLSRQTRRAAVSSMAYTAEGFERRRPVEFQYLSTARASCAEVRSHLCVVLDAGYLRSTMFDNSMAAANEVADVIGGLRTSSPVTHHSSLTRQP